MSLIENAELHALAVDLTKAGPLAAARAVPVIRKGCANIMNTARASASGMPHARLYPQSITFDVTVERDGIDGKVGPDKDRPQGALGNLIEYGSANNPPHNDLGAALDAEAPRTEEFLADTVAIGLL